MNPDKVTTVIGAVVAAGTAAQPVMNAVQGSMHQADWMQLLASVAMAIFGYFTNKHPAE